MSFNIKQKITFEWPVKLRIPGLKTYVEKEIVFKFKYLKQDEVEKTVALEYVTFCLQNVIGWDGIVDDNEKPVEFSPENLAELLQFAGFAKEIFTTYLKVLSGVVEKN